MAKVNLLTYLTFELNGLVDRQYSMPMQETLKCCEERTIFQELEHRFPFKETGLDLSLLQSDVRRELADAFREIALAGDVKEHYNVENNGLCLLISYAQELIQRQAREAGI
jgi:hypothetical protein